MRVLWDFNARSWYNSVIRYWALFIWRAIFLRIIFRLQHSSRNWDVRQIALIYFYIFFTVYSRWLVYKKERIFRRCIGILRRFSLDTVFFVYRRRTMWGIFWRLFNFWANVSVRLLLLVSLSHFNFRRVIL